MFQRNSDKKVMSNTYNFSKYNLCYMIYNKDDMEQQKFLEECEEDRDLFSFALDAQKYALFDKMHGEGYLVMDLDIQKYIGICILRPAVHDIKTVPTPMSICYGILIPYRNKGYASTILKETVDELFLNRNYSKIALEIKPTNSASLIVANKVGFEVDTEYSKIFEHEGYDYVALSLTKRNKNTTF